MMKSNAPPGSLWGNNSRMIGVFSQGPGMETRQNFSRMFVIAKKLFAPTLNRIPASVRCVSSMIVVLKAKFARFQLRTKNTVRNEESCQECRVC